MAQIEDPKAERSSIDDIIDIYGRDIDVTLLEENLKLTVEQRFLQLMELQRFAEELQRAKPSSFE